MHPTVKRRIDVQVALRQCKKHTGSTVSFLTREDNSRNLHGKFRKEKSVWIRARRRVLQYIAYQFPCDLQLKIWGNLKDVKFRLCEKYYREKTMDPPDSVESAGHIQCYCPALQLSRIAIHLGLWRELMFSIGKLSTELNDEKEPRWHFPSALSPEAHAEWGLYKILEYMGSIDFGTDHLDTLNSRRPDGLAFDKEEKLYVLLEYTRAMDTNKDWATTKETKKDNT